MTRVALDTSVIVEYIDQRGEYHEQAEAIFSALLAGGLTAIILHPVLSETYVVAARIYKALGLSDAELRAAKLVGWLYRLPTAEVKGLDLELALEAGRVKLRYGVALTDCYVIAASKIYGCKAVFRRREREMLPVIESLEREYSLLFLEDYA
ncbi:MAG: hypothetical protein DRJ96_04660 [Thermoprotei archaeon]|nr:MAG: hypothetical protein DRJ67_07980 [Thermoprotei archaeon]RLE97161.1 MAG: hypothetical protein DRJ96_04660 [Thermoprotei archaeon]